MVTGWPRFWNWAIVNPVCSSPTRKVLSCQPRRPAPARVLALGSFAWGIVIGVGCLPLGDLTPSEPEGLGGASTSVGSGRGAEGGSPQADATQSPQSGSGGVGGSTGGGTSTGGASGEAPSEAGAGGAPPSFGGGPDAGIGFQLADAAVAGPCGAGALQGPDGDCFALLEVSVSWAQARELCIARGAYWDLAAMLDAGVSALLAEHLVVQSWIGASDSGSEGTWRWVTNDVEFWSGDENGAPIDGAFTNWREGEPNGGGDCARVLPAGDSEPGRNAPWADLACTQLRGAICRGPAPPLGQ